MSAKVLLKRSVSPFVWDDTPLGNDVQCYTSRREETSLDRKTAPRSVIITRGAPCLRTISSNYYPFVSMSRLWKSPKEINSNAMERSCSWRMGTKRPSGR
ncbi:hypothetical protein TNCV_2682591 [Trichonephila clavipes]|nr:hypothetical protein TNCV_2682591 [Trichonephila clavipes]